jgi:two-component system response regulator PilR (NtrC family)
MELGEFSRELFAYLAVRQIAVPPLRERRQDIAALAQRLADEVSHQLGRQPQTLSAEVLAELEEHSFPGNVRGLRAILEEAVAAAAGRPLTPGDLRLS